MKIFFLILYISLILNIDSLHKAIKTEIKWVADKNGKKIRKEEEKEFNITGDLVKWVQYNDRIGAISESYTYECANGHKSKKIRH